MKTFTFKLFGRTITFTFGRKKAEEFPEEIKMEEILTVKDCFTAYINDAREKLAAATIKGYENIRDKHLQYIMSMNVKNINDNDIQHAFDEEIEKGYSKKTLKGYWTLLKKVLESHRPDLKADVSFDAKEDNQ